MENAVQYEATICVVQESIRWKGNQIRDNLREIGSGGQSTQIKYLSKSTDTYDKILLQ